jgi:hypothetical protein
MWREGQRATPEELVGETVDFAVLEAELGLAEA